MQQYKYACKFPANLHTLIRKFGSHGKELPPGKQKPQTNNAQQADVKLGNQTT